MVFISMATMSFVESLKPRRISSFIATLALFIVLFVIDVDGFQLQYSGLSPAVLVDLFLYVC